MDRNRETRRTSIVSSNGFNRRRYRTNSLRDSPDEDMGLELHESARLRDRVKKDRDRERDRERDVRDRDLRDRDPRERDLRERPNRIMSSVKRRRNERLTNNRGDAGNDETSEESVNDDEDDEDEDNNTATANHHHHHRDSFSRNTNSNHNNITNSSNSNLVTSTVPHHLQQGKSFPPPNSASNSKAFRAPPVWRSGDEVIRVPRKARSSSTKRSHDWISSSSNNNSGGAAGAGGEQILRQTSASPARQTSIQPPTSPSSSNASLRKKLKASGNNGLKPKSSKPSSSNPEELEIEIAEVLYGLMTHSQGPSSSKKEEVNRSSSDARSRHSSPVSNATSNNNLVSVPNRSPLTAIAPKRKKPRQVPENLSYGGVQMSSITAKDADQTSKSEISSPNNLDKISSHMEGSSVISQAQPPELASQVLGAESRPLASELRDDKSNLVSKEEIISPKERESSLVRTEAIDNEVSTSLPTSNFSKVGTQKEEKYEIDLMAPPPQVRSSPERETVLDSSYVAADQKPVMSVVNVDLKAPVISKENDEDGKEKVEEKKRNEAESVEASENVGLKIGLQLDLEKPERAESDNANKLPYMSSKAVREDVQVPERHGQSASSLPLPLSVASWPGGFPPMGYMAAPLPGVVSMDGATVAPAPIQPMLSQPRSKRCATHCHVARNIYYQQQFMKMNPFWPGAAGSPLFGPKPANLSVMPGSDLAIKDKSQNHPSNNNAPINKISPSQPANNSDSSQRKQQVLIQQGLPPHVAPNNLMAPAFIFPLNQSARPGTVKSATNAPSSSSSSVTNASSAQSMPMPFSYPNVGPNEPQYLAILQNNGYPFPIPPGFRGPPGQPMPVFNGSFYPSQMIHHPSQLQQQQPSSLSQNANASNGSSSSQKHSQQRPPQSVGNTSFASSQKPSHNSQQHASMSRPRQVVEGEMNSEDSPSNDSRGSSSRLPPAVNMYGQNFTIHPQNFALMTPSSTAYGSSNQSEKKTNQPQQQQQGMVVKTGVESLAPHHGFAMSFGPSIDMSSMVQNHHAMFQSSPEVARQMMAAAANKKNVRVSDDGKSSAGGESSNAANDDERKVKSQASVGQSIAFARSDFPDSNSHARGSRASSGSVVGSINVQSNNAHSIQSQIQQQQILQLKHQQQQQLAAANRGSKGPSTGNGNVFSDHLNSSSSNVAAKFPMIQMSQSPSQATQWKGSSGTRTSNTPQVVQPPLASSSSSTFKGAPQQQNSRILMHGQISFGGNHKPNTSAAASQGQGPSSGNPTPSSPMMSNSPTTSSISKGASGSTSSPRTNVSASATNIKTSQGSPNLSSAQQHPKNSPSMLPGQKSPSILGNPQSNSSANNGAKAQFQPQQLMAKNMQQAQQLFFSNPFGQVQSSSPNASGAGVYFMSHQQKRPDKNQQLMQATASTGMLSLSPCVTVTSNSTTDPAKALAAATGNGKSGGSLPSQGVFNASQFGVQPVGPTLLTGFPYVQTKPSEQKQPAAGNENLHAWQPEKK